MQMPQHIAEMVPLPELLQHLPLCRPVIGALVPVSTDNDAAAPLGELVELAGEVMQQHTEC